MPTFVDSITNHPGTLSMIVALPLFGVLAKVFGAKFQQIAKWYLYIAVFAIVIVMNSMFFPFIGGKDYFFRFTVELALIFYILSWAFEMRQGELSTTLRALFKKPLVIAVTAFVAMFLLACVFALDKHAAFLSNYERGEGGFQMLHYYIYFLLLALTLRAENDWKNIFRFSLVAAGIMIIYGLCANFLVAGFIGPYAQGVIPTSFWHLLVDGRFQGTLGNPAYVAPYLMFAMFFGAYLWNSRREKGKNVWVNIRYIALLLIFLVFFYLSQTRGAFLGLGAGLFVLLLYFVIAGRGSFRKWSVIAFALFLIVGGAVYILRDSSLANKIPGGRLLQISLSESSAQTRLWVWGEAWEGFKERPIFGWGPENFTAVFDRHFNPKFFDPMNSTETWFDRAHSVYFDYLAETGALGLLSWLSIFIVFAWQFFAKQKMHPNSGSAHSTHVVVERGIFLAMPVAYLVQGVAIFDVLPMYISLFLFLGFAYFYFYEKHGHNR